MSTRSTIDSHRERSLTDGVSLDEFQARYTSEDNASFATIIDDENRQRKEKWAWAWDAQRRAEGHKAIEGARRETLLLEPGRGPLAITAAGETGTTEKSEALESLPTDEGKGHEVVLSQQPDGASQEVLQVDSNQEMEDVMAPKKDTRSAGVPGWNFKVWLSTAKSTSNTDSQLQARNSLMFPPDANQSPYELISSAPVPAPTRGEPKAIKYGATRIIEQEEPSGAAEPSSPTHSRVDAAIAGRPCEWPRPPFFVWRILKCGVDASGGETPKVAGHSFVSETASPSPSQLGPIGLKQLMTWGTLQGTPRVISSEDGESISMAEAHTPFRIVEPSRRDALSHRLSNKASKSLAQRAALLSPYPQGQSAMPGSQHGPIRSSKRPKGNMPPPVMTPRRSEVLLSPAARRLLGRTGGGPTLSQREGWGEAATRPGKDLGRERWTPSPATSRQL